MNLAIETVLLAAARAVTRSAWYDHDQAHVDPDALEALEAVSAAYPAVVGVETELREALRGLMQWVEEVTSETDRLNGHWPSNWARLTELVEPCPPPTQEE